MTSSRNKWLRRSGFLALVGLIWLFSIYLYGYVEYYPEIRGWGSAISERGHGTVMFPTQYAQTHWHKGTSYGLRSDKTIFKENEPIEFDLVAQNRTIFWQAYCTCSDIPDLELAAYGIDGKLEMKERKNFESDCLSTFDIWVAPFAYISNLTSYSIGFDQKLPKGTYDIVLIRAADRSDDQPNPSQTPVPAHKPPGPSLRITVE